MNRLIRDVVLSHRSALHFAGELVRTGLNGVAKPIPLLGPMVVNEE
jgi:hypothetical protein